MAQYMLEREELFNGMISNASIRKWMDYIERVPRICSAWSVLQGGISLECGAQILSVNLILKRIVNSKQYFPNSRYRSNIGKVDC